MLAPSPWRNTGLGPDQLQRCVDLPQINWAIADRADHPSLRTTPADPDGLIGYVTDLAPDIILCRSADFETTRHFPGIVRSLMEVTIAPFAISRPSGEPHRRSLRRRRYAPIAGSGVRAARRDDGFSREDFFGNHPAGLLGRQQIPVRALMR